MTSSRWPAGAHGSRGPRPRRSALSGTGAPSCFFFSSRRRHTRLQGDWSSDVCSSESLLAESSAERAAALEIAIPPGPRLGDLVVEADHVTKAYGDRVLVDDLSFKLPRGGIVGVIGPNGAGKTTLFGMITGREKPDAGALRVGETVRLAYVDQSRDALDPAKTVWEAIGGGADTLTLGSRTVPSRDRARRGSGPHTRA